jgi:hypothetical protein
MTRHLASFARESNRKIGVTRNYLGTQPKKALTVASGAKFTCRTT